MNEKIPQFAIGELVTVYPALGLVVREHPDLRRALPATGKKVAWSAWLLSKLSTGEICLSDPAPQPAPPAPKAGKTPVKE